MKSASCQICWLPTGGCSKCECSSSQRWKLNGMPNLNMVSTSCLVRFIGYRLDLYQQVRVRQLMHGHRGAGRAVIVKIFAVHFVIAAEVVHVNQETADLY